MRRIKPHWSRHPGQIAKDEAFLAKLGLVFEQTPSGFQRLRTPELKENLIDRQMEIQFDRANDPEHQLTQIIWNEHIEELEEA
jgi:hypothetical protein